MLSNKQVEEIEYKYLKKFYHFLKYSQDELLEGLSSKEKIRGDWEKLWGNDQRGSENAVGAERIVYSLLNGHSFGSPNSNPVSSDMFFEFEDAFVHFDLKSYYESNVGDFKTMIDIGVNQNSYAGTIIKERKENEEYKPNLPFYYNKGKENEKICLTFFFAILGSDSGSSTEVISLICVPNGQLKEHYQSRPLKAGKNHGKARFNLKECNKFELLDNQPSRVFVPYVNPDMSDGLKKELQFYLNDLSKRNINT